MFIIGCHCLWLRRLEDVWRWLAMEIASGNRYLRIVPAYIPRCSKFVGRIWNHHMPIKPGVFAVWNCPPREFRKSHWSNALEFSSMAAHRHEGGIAWTILVDGHSAFRRIELWGCVKFDEREDDVRIPRGSCISRILSTYKSRFKDKWRW